MKREDIAKMAADAGFLTLSIFDEFIDKFEVFANKVAAVEREACAKVCDELAAKDKLSNYYAVAARAIRDRGEK